MMKKTLYNILSHSEEETRSAGMLLASQISDDSFIALYGDLGAGKTAFVTGLCAVYLPTAEVSSPTYAIVNEYEDPSKNRKLCHMDAYRLSSEDDLESIGFYDYKNCVIACEWCEKIPFALPEKYFKVTITGSGDGLRKILIERIEK